MSQESFAHIRNVQHSFNGISHSVVGSNNVVRGNSYGLLSLNTTAIINGKKYEKFKNMKITVEYTNEDGETKKDEFPDLFLTINIENDNMDVSVNGDVDKVQVYNAPLTVTGNVGGDAKTTNATLKIEGNVGGNATTTNGNIKANNIGGSCQTSNGRISGSKKRQKADYILNIF